MKKLIFLAVALVCISCSRDKGKINGHEYVDLGLPSGLKWATCNVGAANVYSYGDRFNWGALKDRNDYFCTDEDGYYEDAERVPIDIVFGKNYKDSLIYRNKSVKDVKDISGDIRFDAARKKWGGSWRIPTKSEIQELIDVCEWKWMNVAESKGDRQESSKGSGAYCDECYFVDNYGCRYYCWGDGYMVTGPNGNSIFIPAVLMWLDGVPEWRYYGGISSSTLADSVNGFHLVIQNHDYEDYGMEYFTPTYEIDSSWCDWYDMPIRPVSY